MLVCGSKLQVNLSVPAPSAWGFWHKQGYLRWQGPNQSSDLTMRTTSPTFTFLSAYRVEHHYRVQLSNGAKHRLSIRLTPEQYVFALMPN